MKHFSRTLWSTPLPAPVPKAHEAVRRWLRREGYEQGEDNEGDCTAGNEVVNVLCQVGPEYE